MKAWLKRLACAAALLTILGIWVSCTGKTTIPPAVTTTPNATAPEHSTSPSVSNGERIYTTSTSASGQIITYTGGPGGMMQGPLACVNCHGNNGHGGNVYFMMQTFDIPSIAWPDLTAQDMDHPPYTDETLKRAITQGLDPAGNSVEYPMPLWHMSAPDLNDLAAYIETLR